MKEPAATTSTDRDPITPSSVLNMTEDSTLSVTITIVTAKALCTDVRWARRHPVNIPPAAPLRQMTHVTRQQEQWRAMAPG